MPKFDATITLGNVITFITVLAAVAGAWSSQNERISRMEMSHQSLEKTDARHDADIRSLKNDIHDALAEIKNDIKDLRNDIKGKK
ncbi:MAG: hypothetical protein ACKVOO_10885 [Burkholderiaceae bacterium]